MNQYDWVLIEDFIDKETFVNLGMMRFLKNVSEGKTIFMLSKNSIEKIFRS